jgi:hypothetical protein
MAAMSQQNQLQVYRRSNFQNVVRWIAFGAIVILDLSAVWQTIITLSAGGANIGRFFKQILAYLILVATQAVIIPMIVLEARKVEVLPDKLVVHNLLYTNTIDWSDIKAVIAPIYLKFAIIKTPRWFVLINKRDVEGFSDLIQIIRDKAEVAPKS